MPGAMGGPRRDRRGAGRSILAAISATALESRSAVHPASSRERPCGAARDADDKRGSTALTLLRVVASRKSKPGTIKAPTPDLPDLGPARGDASGLAAGFMVAWCRVTSTPMVDVPPEVREEANTLAQHLVSRIRRLHAMGWRGQTLANLNAGYANRICGERPRGFCYDWADELDAVIRDVETEFGLRHFGHVRLLCEATFDEHHVVSIYPRAGTWRDGVVVDPWRILGEPFWVGVDRDPDYRWRTLYPE